MIYDLCEPGEDAGQGEDSKEGARGEGRVLTSRCQPVEVTDQVRGNSHSVTFAANSLGQIG